MFVPIDERIRTELASVAAGRNLSRSEAGWLARALTGAVRPNRDAPLLDLARGLAVLGRLDGAGDQRALVARVFDPALARPAALAALLDQAPPGALARDGRGVILPGWDRPLALTVLARSLGLAEIVALVDGSSLLPDLVSALRQVTDDSSVPAVEDAGRALARALHAWRMRCLPFAAVERGLRRLATLGAEPGALDDAAILDLFCAEIRAGERPVFHSLVRLVATLERARRHGLDLHRLSQAMPLDAAPEVEAALADIAGGDEASLEERLGRVPARPKCLTGVERRHLEAVVALDPLHRTRPLTALRALAFEPVQSGILNRQRRGSGGAGVAARTACAEARPYPDLTAATAALHGHLRDLLRIALALRVEGCGAAPDDPRAGAAVQEGRRALKAMRREGFDARPDDLRAAFEGMDECLADLAGALDDALARIAALDEAAPLESRFEADRTVFAGLFAQLYADPSVQEAPHGIP
ncbi:hypothetical protein [Salinarimonas soli]|uniref:Uncharacterized protein n=1 Tax=Salinarimonas soli TaxID=1638099 RepID=A0A5B2V928_9HYPH|nr:hypothetical protein [Salinarimonas soli]KAA2235075.1 hypothetical protein F0L46_22345 [Salinarimonas soli]